MIGSLVGRPPWKRRFREFLQRLPNVFGEEAVMDERGIPVTIGWLRANYRETLPAAADGPIPKHDMTEIKVGQVEPLPQR